MKNKEQFYHHNTVGFLGHDQTGGGLENDNWYYLVTDGQGNQSVVREWEREDAYRMERAVRRSSRSYAIAAFLHGKFPAGAKAALRELLELQPA